MKNYLEPQKDCSKEDKEKIYKGKVMLVSGDF